jgi:hypothetical protein
MKRYLTAGVIAFAIALVALPCLHHSAGAQDRPKGYWEFQKAEIFGTDKDKKEILSRETFDVKKGTGWNGFWEGSASGIARMEGVHRWNMWLVPKDVPEIMKSDGEFLAQPITGHVYAELTEAKGWPDFIKFGINDDGQTASGETLTGFGGGEGYTHIAKLGKREEASFSTAGLSLPKSAEDFAVRVMVRVTDKATIDYKSAETYTFLFHYKWRPGSITAAAATGKTTAEPTYLGCYKDTSSLDLNGYLERSRSNTPQRCIAICHDRGFKYAAVQYGESCLCGNSYGKYGQATNCDYKCTGDPNQICGGYSTNSIYQIR